VSSRLSGSTKTREYLDIPSFRRLFPRSYRSGTRGGKFEKLHIRKWDFGGKSDRRPMAKATVQKTINPPHLDMTPSWFSWSQSAAPRAMVAQSIQRTTTPPFIAVVQIPARKRREICNLAVFS
jgi:hypothetical protein